jgi:hypothetical protein
MFRINELVTRAISSFGTSQDEDSIEPASLGYDINMVNNSPKGRKNQSSPSGSGQEKNERGGRRGGNRARSTSSNRGAEGDDEMMKILNNIRQLCTETKEEVKQVSEKLTATTKEVGEMKAKITEVEKRVETVEKNSAGLEARLEAKIIEKLSGRLQKKTVSLDPSSSTPGKPFPPVYKSSSIPSLVSKSSRPLEKPVSQKTLPKVPNVDGKQLHAAFEDLLQEQEAKKCCFLVGAVKETTEDGVAMKPKISYAHMVRRFFDGVRYKMSPLSTAKSNGMPLGKVQVHPQDAHVVKMRCRDNWREPREFGWWIGQENPVDLRQMEVNAFRFIMEGKKEQDGLQRYYIEAENGFLRFARVPFLPVYMVPEDKAQWPELFPILLEMVKSIGSKNWVSRFRGVKKLDSRLLEAWNSVLNDGASDESCSYDSEDSDVTEKQLRGKLLYLGRVPRAPTKTRASMTGVMSQTSQTTPGVTTTVDGLRAGGVAVGGPDGVSGSLEEQMDVTDEGGSFKDATENNDNDNEHENENENSNKNGDGEDEDNANENGDVI